MGDIAAIIRQAAEAAHAAGHYEAMLSVGRAMAYLARDGGLTVETKLVVSLIGAMTADSEARYKLKAEQPVALVEAKPAGACPP